MIQINPNRSLGFFRVVWQRDFLMTDLGLFYFLSKASMAECVIPLPTILPLGSMSSVLGMA